MDVRRAGGTKNVLAAAMNASAALALGLGAIAGGRLGAAILMRIDPLYLQLFVVAIVAMLTVGLFWRAY